MKQFEQQIKDEFGRTARFMYCTNMRMRQDGIRMNITFKTDDELVEDGDGFYQLSDWNEISREAARKYYYRKGVSHSVWNDEFLEDINSEAMDALDYLREHKEETEQ